MRGGGGKTVERGELLFASQHHFGCGQGFGHLAGFSGDAAGIDGGKNGSAQKRRPQPGHKKRRHDEGFAFAPGQRQMKRGQQRRKRQRQGGQQNRVAGRQGGGGDHDGHEEQKGEGIFEATGQIQEGRQLDDVITQEERGAPIGQAQGGAPAKGEENVEPRRQGDDGKAKA